MIDVITCPWWDLSWTMLVKDDADVWYTENYLKNELEYDLSFAQTREWNHTLILTVHIEYTVEYRITPCDVISFIISGELCW